MKQKRRTVSHPPCSKKARPQYETPSLTRYGGVGKLTASMSADPGVVDGIFEETFDPLS